MTDPGLGPFAPPESWRPEPELLEPTPRAVPEEVRNGPFASARRRGLRVAAFTGIACIVVGVTGVLDRLAYYVLPLGYLTYVGVAVLVIAGLVALTPGPLASFRDGAPLVARVLDVTMAVKSLHNGVPNEYHFLVLIECIHPDRGELTRFQVASPGIAAMWKDSTTTPLRPGQYVTAIHVPGKTATTLTLYGFLQLTSSSDLLIRSSGGTWSAMAIAGSLVAFFGSLIFGLYALEFYEPIDTPTDVIAESAAGGLFLAGIAAFFIVRAGRRRLARQEAEREAARLEGRPIAPPAPTTKTRAGYVILALFLWFICALAVASTLFTLNAELDRSAPLYHAVEITNFWQTTHSFLIRTYSIEYRAPDGGSKKLASTYEHMGRFTVKAGAVEVRAGALGWPWVKQVHPVKLESDASGDSVVLAELEDGRVVEIARKRAR